jgi:hypothetical protein
VVRRELAREVISGDSRACDLVWLERELPISGKTEGFLIYQRWHNQ